MNAVELAALGPEVIIPRGSVSRVIVTVKNFSASFCGVSVFPQMLHERDGMGEFFTKLFPVAEHAGF